MKFSEYVALTLKVETCSVVIARKITNFSLIFWLLNYGHVKSDKKRKPLINTTLEILFLQNKSSNNKWNFSYSKIFGYGYILILIAKITHDFTNCMYNAVQNI